MSRAARPLLVVLGIALAGSAIGVIALGHELKPTRPLGSASPGSTASGAPGASAEPVASDAPRDSEEPVASDAAPPAGSNALLIPPVGPAASALPTYVAPDVQLRDLDPGLATRGPRPSLHTLASTYQYGNPTVMFSSSSAPDEWRLANPDSNAVVGYASDISVRPGSMLRISLAGIDAWADLDVFRMGRGDARHVLHLAHVTVPPVRQAAPQPGTGLVDEGWPAATTIAVGETWQSGVYLVKLTGSSGGQSYVPFIVRPVHPGAFTVVIPTMTYEAYNDYGGSDLYGWAQHIPARAFAVSFDRPFFRQFGAGLFFRLDFPLVVWLEDRGYTPDYIADVDMARDPTLLAGVRTLAFSGHSEYWTAGMRNEVDAAARAGTNLAFFGANQAFWQVRMAPGDGGVADRVIVCYKSVRLDPQAAADPHGATVRFEESPVNKPPSLLMGEKYGGIVLGVTPMRLGPGIGTFAPGVGLHEGEQLPGLIGEEVDELHHGFRGVALGQTPTSVVEHPARILVGAAVWINPLGDRVFDAGTFDYSWGLDPRYSAALPGFDGPAFSMLTARILAWLGALPAA